MLLSTWCRVVAALMVLFHIDFHCALVIGAGIVEGRAAHSPPLGFHRKVVVSRRLQFSQYSENK